MAQRRLIAQQAREAEALAAAEKVRLRVEAEEAAIAKAAADREAQREAARSARAQARTVSAPQVSSERRCPCSHRPVASMHLQKQLNSVATMQQLLRAGINVGPQPGDAQQHNTQPVPPGVGVRGSSQATLSRGPSRFTVASASSAKPSRADVTSSGSYWKPAHTDGPASQYTGLDKALEGLTTFAEEDELVDSPVQELVDSLTAAAGMPGMPLRRQPSEKHTSGRQHAKTWAPTSRGATPLYKARPRGPLNPPKLSAAESVPKMHPHHWWRWFSYDSDLDASGRPRRRAAPTMVSSVGASPKRTVYPVLPRRALAKSTGSLPMAGSRLGGRYQPVSSPVHSGGHHGGFRDDARDWPSNHRRRPRVSTKPSTLAERMPKLTRSPQGSTSPTSTSRFGDSSPASLRSSRAGVSSLAAAGRRSVAPSPLRRSMQPPKNTGMQFDAQGNLLPRLPELASPTTGLDMCIGPDQGTVQTHFMGLLSVSRSPQVELQTPHVGAGHAGRSKRRGR